MRIFIEKKKQNFSEQLENQINDTDENNILDEKFPMKSLADVRDIEQQLKNDETFKKQLVRINRNILYVFYLFRTIYTFLKFYIISSYYYII